MRRSLGYFSITCNSSSYLLPRVWERGRSARTDELKLPTEKSFDFQLVTLLMSVTCDINEFHKTCFLFGSSKPTNKIIHRYQSSFFCTLVDFNHHLPIFKIWVIRALVLSVATINYAISFLILSLSEPHYQTVWRMRFMWEIIRN